MLPLARTCEVNGTCSFHLPPSDREIGVDNALDYYFAVYDECVSCVVPLAPPIPPEMRRRGVVAGHRGMGCHAGVPVADAVLHIVHVNCRYIIKYDKLVPGPSHFTSATFAKPDMPCTDFSDNGLMVQGAMPLHTMEGHFDQFAKLHKREYRYVGSQHSTPTAVFPVCPHKRKLACACALIAVSGDDERVERQRYFQSNARFISAYNRKYVTPCYISLQERRLAVE